MSRTQEKAVLWSIAAAYLIYLVLRVYGVPMTQDEVATCYNHVPRGVLDILTYAKEAVPNNHILNTLSIKMLSGIFGMGVVPARLPALLGGVAFLLGALALVRLISANPWLRIAWLVLLIGNPYMAEFFALGRGYGLSIGFMVPAIVFAWKYLETHGRRDLIAALGLAGLAVMANFTVLNFFLPLVLLLYIAIRQQATPEQERRRQTWILFAAVLLLAALCGLPIYRMTADNELQFWGTEGFYQNTLSPLVWSLTMDHRYLGGGHTVPVFARLIVAFSLIGWVVAVWRWGNRRWQVGTDPLVFAGFLFAGTITVNLLQYFLLDVPFLNARTAVFLYPLLALQWIAAGELMWRQYRRRALVFIVPLLLLTVVNFDNGRNLNRSFEWSYDSGTFQVLDFIKKQSESEGRTQPFTLDTHRQLQNSLNFHVEFGRPFAPPYSRWVTTPQYHNNVLPLNNTDFYYTNSKEEIEALRSGYDPVLTVEPDVRVLFRRRQ